MLTDVEIDPNFDCPDPPNRFPKPIARSHPAAIAPCQQQITPFKTIQNGHRLVKQLQPA
jgi:hypothetical protein